jgi:hypothetical protein
MTPVFRRPQSWCSLRRWCLSIRPSRLRPRKERTRNSASALKTPRAGEAWLVVTLRATDRLRREGQRGREGQEGQVMHHNRGSTVRTSSARPMLDEWAAAS